MIRFKRVVLVKVDRHTFKILRLINCVSCVVDGGIYRIGDEIPFSLAEQLQEENNYGIVVGELPPKPEDFTPRPVPGLEPKEVPTPFGTVNVFTHHSGTGSICVRVPGTDSTLHESVVSALSRLRVAVGFYASAKQELFYELRQAMNNRYKVRFMRNELRDGGQTMRFRLLASVTVNTMEEVNIAVKALNAKQTYFTGGLPRRFFADSMRYIQVVKTTPLPLGLTHKLRKFVNKHEAAKYIEEDFAPNSQLKWTYCPDKGAPQINALTRKAVFMEYTGAGGKQICTVEGDMADIARIATTVAALLSARSTKTTGPVFVEEFGV